MGGGNTPEALVSYAGAVRELWPNMTMEDFADAMKHGLRHVNVSYKLTCTTIAQFIRAYNDHPDRWKAFELRFRQQHGRNPNSGDPLTMVPAEYRVAKWT